MALDNMFSDVYEQNFWISLTQSNSVDNVLDKLFLVII